MQKHRNSGQQYDAYQRRGNGFGDIGEQVNDAQPGGDHKVGHIRDVDEFGQLRDENERAAFMADVQAMFQELSGKYGRQQETAEEVKPPSLFKLALTCYPKPLSK